MGRVAEVLGVNRASPSIFPSASPYRAVRHCAELWRRLPQRNGAPRQQIVPPREIGDTSGVECPIHTAINVVTGIDAARHTSPIHANLISFESGREAIAGQSPQTFAFTEKFLVQGLDSGAGLFQFVDPKNHRIDQLTQTPTQRPALRLRRGRPETTVLGQLLSRWQDSLDKQAPLVLAGRFRVTELVEDACDGTHARYLMTATDLQNENQTITVPLTQAALTFENNVLRVDQIEQADTMLEAHCASTPLRAEAGDAANAASVPRHREPTILSKKGIGRNAALITYREVLAKIADTEGSLNLLDALEQVVSKERLDRGKHFLHSESQLEEVYDALNKYTEEHRQGDQAAPMPPSPARRSPILQAHEADVANINRPVSPVVEPAAVSPIEPPIDHRARTLALLHTHASDTPLQLFDALADEHSQVAAFCAIQVRRALTAIPGTSSGDYEHASRHAGVSVDIVASESAGVFSEPSMGFEQNNEIDEPPQTISLQNLLIHDLEKALPLRDANADADAGANANIQTDPFPGGFTAALQITHRDTGDIIAAPVAKLSADDIAPFLAQHTNTSPLQLMEHLAENNPSLTSLINFIELGLLLRDSHRPAQCERYDYVPGNAEEDAFFTKRKGGKGQTHFPTFIAGINRALYSRHEAWQIEAGEQSRLTNSHTEVFQHVIGHALHDLNSPAVRSNSPGLFPLPLYKLLANAVGLSEIPPYLREFEATRVETTSKNKVKAQHTAQQSREAHLEREGKRAEDRRHAQADTVQHYAERGVKNWQEDHLLRNGDYKDDLLSRSVDITVALPARDVDPQLLKNLKKNLPATHQHQAINSRCHYDPSIDVHTSWLNCSWLSLFEMLTPQQLADGRRALENHPAGIENDARLLQSIAEYYRQNPAAFMQGKAIAGIDDPADVIPREAAFNHPALLGSPLPLDQILHCSPDDPFHIPDYDSIRSFLSQEQLVIAMALRAQYPGIESELARLLITPGPGSSALPITLHRAFGVPLVLVEESPNGPAVGNGVEGNAIGRLRMTAPTDGAMAHKFNALKNQANVNEDVMTPLAIDWATTPVIWREGTHYSLYLPKAQEAEELNRIDPQQDDDPLPPNPPEVPPRDKRWFSWMRN